MRATVKGFWVAAAVGLMPGLSMAQPPERGGGEVAQVAPRPIRPR